MIKKLLIALLLTPTFIYAQENHGSCSHVKRRHNSTLKSNTLTVAQIAETEKYDVSYYFLNLNMTNTTTTLSGITEIHATAREFLDSALIELFNDFTIQSISVDGVPTLYSRQNSAIKIPVTKNQGESFVLTIDYLGTPPNATSNPLGGSGMTNQNSGAWGNQVTWSLSEPFSAFEWFPVKQSLTDKADSCAVWITVPTACKAGSNGVLEQVVDLGNGTHRFEWKHRHPIDYYLISVAVAEYVEYNVTANPVGSGPVLIQNFIYNNPSTLPFFQDEIDETVDYMELFAQLFGPYPFADEKYGHCMAPISGGMEHQTMTTQGFFQKGLTDHELAHQWFGDHITCSSWADIWVNEGFASYAEYLMLEYLYPSEEIQDMLDRHTNIMSQTGGSVWVEDSLNDDAIFDGRLVYNKGAAIVHTLRFLVDDDTLFYNALKNCQTVYADSTASGLEIIEQFELESGKDFSDFAQQWYFGEGYPTYGVRWNTVGTNTLVEINHTASKPSATPLFTNDLELTFDRTSLPDTVIRFAITNNTVSFNLSGIGEVSNITKIDPNNWICNKESGIVKDPNFLTVSEHKMVEDVKIYPNPSNGIVNIELEHNQPVQYTVYDTKGRKVIAGSFSGKTSLDFTKLPLGTYIISFKNNQTNEQFTRLIKH